ncbi:MAG TPA: trehalose-6-phosphate synthase [Polyangiaceae bacterium]|nr:trehalose-6-phosphate synthase [Polyangiaceae bacterium]
MTQDEVGQSQLRRSTLHRVQIWYCVKVRRALRFLLVLLVGLGVLTMLAYWGITGTTREWFQKDLRLRTELAVSAAGQSLAANWTDPHKLRESLTNIARDERVIGAAACSPTAEVLTATEHFPSEFSCSVVLNGSMSQVASHNRTWWMTSESSLGHLQVSATSLESEGRPLGYILLVHDLGFMSRREAATVSWLLTAFVLLSVLASIVTLAAARWAWRSWTSELQRALAGQSTPEFQPLMREVRTLVERLSAERETETRAGPWNPERLRAVLARHLSGGRVVVLANREPYVHERGPSGVQVLHPASGLVTALEPVMRACSGVWVAHGSGSADRETVDAHDRVRVPPAEESYWLRRIWLNEEEERGYYYGFSNEGLWPLCHVAHTRPIFRSEDWEQYVRVNRKFAEAACAEADTVDPIVLVQDYHFALAPRMIRERLPQATIVTFWHIPWPNAERMGICPWATELVSGLLGSSIIGFHTQQHCNNFVDTVDAYMESRIDRESQAIVQSSQRTLVRPYPISIDWPVHWLKDFPSARECRGVVRAELGLAEDAMLGVGVDRLDYTKGIEERLLAVDSLLTHYPEYRDRFVFAQLAAPSRTKIDPYRELNARVEALAERINDKWRNQRYQPIVLLRQHHEPRAVFRFFRAADLCYVSSLHDGMNLVAKEFVAARDDELGVLVLSQFTGAARELTEALIVNPYDIQQAGRALATALQMRPTEQRERMRAMRRMVSEFNVYRWAGKMLTDAAELRRRARVTGQLGKRPGVGWLDTPLPRRRAL